MDTDMEFEQGGSADALAIFQEAFNAQQRPAPSVGHDRKMLYVDLFVTAPPSAPAPAYSPNRTSNYTTMQRPRLCARLHR
jgi:hypothetical protein